MNIPKAPQKAVLHKNGARGREGKQALFTAGRASARHSRGGGSAAGGAAGRRGGAVNPGAQVPSAPGAGGSFPAESFCRAPRRLLPGALGLWASPPRTQEPPPTPRGKQPPTGAGLSLAVCWGTLALKSLDALSVRFLTPGS